MTIHRMQIYQAIVSGLLLILATGLMFRDADPDLLDERLQLVWKCLMFRSHII